MIDDLDAVTIRVGEVYRPCAVAMSSGGAAERNPPTLEIHSPAIDVVRRPDEQPQMVQSCLTRSTRWRRAMEGKIVSPGRQIRVVAVGLPLDPKPEHIDVEALRLVECLHEQRDVAKAELRRSVGHAIML